MVLEDLEDLMETVTQGCRHYRAAPARGTPAARLHALSGHVNARRQASASCYTWTRACHAAAAEADVTAVDYPEAALSRVHNTEPDMVIPLSFFDYDSWDKKTKPAGFNMTIPPELEEEAARHQDARRNHMVDVPIFDGRPFSSSLTLDDSGMCMQHAPTALRGEDFYDIERVHTVYFDECVEFVKRMTGATAVLPFDHSIRNTLRAGEDGVGGPSACSRAAGEPRAGAAR